MARRILVVDDEPGIRKLLADILGDEGFAVDTAADAAEGTRMVGEFPYPVVLLDVWLPDKDGLAVFSEWLEHGIDSRVVFISGHANIASAVQATRMGAFDFLEKPLHLERVVTSVRNALKQYDLEETARRLTGQEQEPFQLVGESPAMQELRGLINRVGGADTRVLITGENGTGKEQVARALHQVSPRKDKPFLGLNCAALPEELIESELFGHTKGAFTGATSHKKGMFLAADGGTLLLDEIGDMALKTQAKLLRVLEEGTVQPIGSSRTLPVDVRILAATNQDLEGLIKEGRFRQDLFYRLNVFPIQVPPLRERQGDVALLMDHFFSQLLADRGGKPPRMSPETVAALQSYGWPGNVRELKNLAERLWILFPDRDLLPRDLGPAFATEGPQPAERVQAEDLPIESSLPLREAREGFERRYILQVLEEVDFQVNAAAKKLGLERSHLYRKLRQYGIELPGR